VDEMNYQEFLLSKMAIAKESGFDVSDLDINQNLLPHQRDAVRWAIKGGRRALFESFGLGKTVQQLEILRLIIANKGGKALVVCPLGVRQEFKQDAKNILGLDVGYVSTMADCEAAPQDIVIANYERVRDGDIDPKKFTATSLDEASVLRSFGSKTYQSFLNLFKGVPYKFVCTATPSPNRFKELIHYGGYLEVMDTGLALTRFFQRDSAKAGNLTIHPHKEDEFWLWVSTWALFITKPSDLGYDDTGYDLPPLRVIYHEVPVDHSSAPVDDDGRARLFRDAAQGLKEAAKEKRDSITARVGKMMDIINDTPDDHYILWHDLEAERHAIKKALPQAVEVYGSEDIEIREKNIIDFSQGKTQFLATKPRLSGSGCNFQKHCHKVIFLGIGYKFNDFMQAIHRVQRFLQPEEVTIHIIYTESEKSILDVLLKKWQQHEYIVERMIGIIRKYGLSMVSLTDKMGRSIGVDRLEIKGEHFTAVNADCIIESARMETNSIDLIHTSIPFSNHYEYTPSYNDLGHNENNDRFFEQMDYLSPELLRILKPGRVFACHVKDRILFGNATGTGMPTIDPFHADCIKHYIRHGFQFFGMITVITDVVRENNQTYRLGWTECTKDGSKMGVGCPEYILLFRKLPSDTSRAYADDPVKKTKDEYTRGQWQIDAHAFWRSSGDRLLSREELENVPVSSLQAAYRKYSRGSVYSYHEHVDLAKKLDNERKLPASFMVVAPGSWDENVWDDINRMRTFNANQKRKNLEMHICPLQFDIVERIINRFSNKGDIVYDPFGGLMTVPVMAVKMGRYGIGSELNPDYFRDGVGYLRQADTQADVPTLFDFCQDNTGREARHKKAS